MSGLYAVLLHIARLDNLNRPAEDINTAWRWLEPLFCTNLIKKNMLSNTGIQVYEANGSTGYMICLCDDARQRDTCEQNYGRRPCVLRGKISVGIQHCCWAGGKSIDSPSSQCRCALPNIIHLWEILSNVGKSVAIELRRLPCQWWLQVLWLESSLITSPFLWSWKKLITLASCWMLDTQNSG